MMTKKAALTAALITTLSTYGSASFAASTVCSEVATLEQATELMTRLFPDSKITNAEPLKVAASKSCLLEVEMLTVQNDPRTRGVVYVLSDGDHFLNGPLMSKRSKVEHPPEMATSAPQAATPEPTTPNIVEAATAAAAAATGTTAPTTAAPAATQPAGNESLKAKTLRELKAHPYVSFNYTNEPQGTANVLFDVSCPFCVSQYKEMETSAKQYDLNFNWIPVFSSERSWTAAALLIKEAEKDAQSARQLLDRFMLGEVSNDEMAQMYKTLDETDFQRAKEINEIYIDIVRQSSGTGTPLTFVESNTDGIIRIASGKLDLKEWPIMLTDD